jgi:hypothetical protein
MFQARQLLQLKQKKTIVINILKMSFSNQEIGGGTGRLFSILK